ncbi:MAG: hypothetical protein ACQERT_13660 [Thermodesulfobacteriota bacterium]
MPKKMYFQVFEESKEPDMVKGYQVSVLPPANLKYFLPQSGQKKKFAGLISDETLGCP